MLQDVACAGRSILFSSVHCRRSTCSRVHTYDGLILNAKKRYRNGVFGNRNSVVVELLQVTMLCTMKLAVFGNMIPPPSEVDL